MGIKVLSLFSGIGAFEKALTNIGVDFELVGFSEIDKYAIESYAAIHNVSKDLNFGDVSKIKKESLPDFDILVGGSPCQAFSVAGNRKGFEDTRGTLFFEYIETLKHKQPKYFVYENVKGLVNHDKGQTFDIITQAFSEVGYKIDMNILNSKYFNVPQNRERLFVVGIREDLIDSEEWSIDKKKKDSFSNGKRRVSEVGVDTYNFNWPIQNEVTIRLRDVLEESVEQKYYLPDEKTTKLVLQLENAQKGDNISDFVGIGHHPFSKKKEFKGYYDEPSPCLIATDYKAPKTVLSIEANIAVELVGNVNPSGNGMNGSVYNTEGLSPTITTNKGEGLKVAIDYSRKEGIGKELQFAHTLSASDWRGLNRNQKQTAVLEEVRATLTPEREEKRQNGRRFKEDDEPAFTVNTIDRHGVAIGNYPTYRIRKLTPLECFRLQAFSDDDFKKAKAAGISNSQLYKQAGNSITVSVLEAIFKELHNTYIVKNEITYNYLLEYVEEDYINSQTI